ncbi:MAG: hypothetical protein GY790_21730 [Bacteroidetes bacterium]|nr:hypothetical protein [Bacteroidota bacterium]
MTLGIMILVMGALMVNKAIYTHVHLQPEGSIHSHAHPFNKSTENKSNSSHDHSGTELFLLDHLDILMLFVSAAFILKQLASRTGFNEPTADRMLPAFVPLTPGRAPPYCM